jgi:hypothetical protein
MDAEAEAMFAARAAALAIPGNNGHYPYVYWPGIDIKHQSKVVDEFIEDPLDTKK